MWTGGLGEGTVWDMVTGMDARTRIEHAGFRGSFHRCPAAILSDAAVREYHADGYYLARGFFDAEEIDLLHRSAKEDNELDKRSFGRADGEGGVVRLSLWNHPGDGIYGMFARCERMVRRCEKLLGGEVYHYHSKMIMKDAKVGGAWAWHQDYGYWYQNGVLQPDCSRACSSRSIRARRRTAACR